MENSVFFLTAACLDTHRTRQKSGAQEWRQSCATIRLFTLSRPGQAPIFLGILLFCFALVRSKDFPKAAGILIFVGVLVYALGPVLSMMVAIGGIIVLSLGCLLLGPDLIRDRRGRGVATSGQGL
jgi:hypothetical protein